MTWATSAACRGMDPDIFHPDHRDEAGIAAAKAVCAVCPVRRQCLAAAMAKPTPEDLGVMGGQSEAERRNARRRARRLRRMAS